MWFRHLIRMPAETKLSSWEETLLKMKISNWRDYLNTKIMPQRHGIPQEDLVSLCSLSYI